MTGRQGDPRGPAAPEGARPAGEGSAGPVPKEAGRSSAAPNRPKARSDAQPLITDVDRRRQLGRSFADRQSLQQAREYDVVRPRYPQQAVEEILAAAGAAAADAATDAATTTAEWAISGGMTRLSEKIPPLNAHPSSGETAQQPSSPQIVDLGAGTGILSRQLLAGGAEVHAVEPSKAMTQVLEEAARDYRHRLQITRAGAEATGLTAGAAHAVVAAQAWHWFDAEAVQTEAARLLAPGGRLNLIWNYLDTAEPIVHRLTRIMRAGDTYRPGWRPALDPRRFTAASTTEYRWTRALSVAGIFRYAMTLSSWLSAEDHQRARRRANLSDFLHRELGLDDDDPVQLPQITVLHAASLRSPARLLD